MPKQIYQLKDFSGGLNSLQDEADINDNQFSTSLNFMFSTQGSITPSYVMSDSSNKLTEGTYSTTHIDHIESGYGLGYFETDHVRDGTTRAFEASGGTSVSITGGSERGWYSSSNELAARGITSSAGATEALNVIFPVGSDILITAETFLNGGIDRDGQGIYTVIGHNSNNLILDRSIQLDQEVDSGGGVTNYSQAWYATVKGISATGDKILLLAHPDEHKIDTFSFNTSGTKWNEDTIVLNSTAVTTKSKVRYYQVDESIRCCDTADFNNSKIKWYGFISRKHFDRPTNITGFTPQNSYLGYYSKDNSLDIPTENDLTRAESTSGGVSPIPAGAGTGFEVGITTLTNVNGAIPAATYEFASSFIYDDNQESLLKEYDTAHTVSDSNDLKSLSINIGAKGPYDPRISGGRIYIREQGIDAEYTMLVDIDLTKGCRTKFSDEYTAWYDNGSNTWNCPTATGSGNFIVKELGLITYEVINGYSSNVFSNALGDAGEHWKDSVIANNRAFVCNVNIKDSNAGFNKSYAPIIHLRDRIMYSMPNRFDTFPSHNYIEAAKGDADWYTAIESFADRLLAFKRFTLDIINIASPDDANWFLEDSKRYMGIQNPELVKKTQYGLVFANPNGLFLYNGNNIINLSENLIDDSDWSSHMTSDSSIIYDEQESHVFVIKQMDGDGDAYMCDLKKNVFTKIKNFTPDSNDGITNSVDTDQNVYIAHDAGSQTDIYQFTRTHTKKTSGRLYTKNLDFGNPSAIKKIYAVYVTYKSDEAITGLFHIRKDGSNIDLAGTIPISSSWDTVKIAPSSPITCTKAQFRLDLDSVDPNVYINDISIEYRVLKRKAA